MEVNLDTLNENQRKAVEWQGLIESGHVPNQAEIARREGIIRSC